MRENNQKHCHRPFTVNQKRSHSLFAEERISQAEDATKSLKRHTDNGTCPDTLQYRTKAKIRADDDFKKDIKRIWKKRRTGNPQRDNTLPSL